MNMRAAFPFAEEPASAPGEPVMAALAEGVSAVFFDAAKGAGGGRLACLLDGAPAEPPFVCTSLARRDGGLRHLALLGRPLAALVERRLALALDGRTVALADPAWLQPPVREPGALVEGLTAEARLRLVRLALGTGASLFLKRRPAYPAFARELLDLSGAEALAPVGQAAFGPHRILTYRVTGAEGAPVLLSPDRIAPLKASALWREAEFLHLHLPAPLGREAEVVLTGARILRLAGAPEEMPAVPLARWAAGRTPGAGAWLEARLRVAAAESPALAAATRELRAEAAQPDLALRHLSATPAGVVYVLALADPERFVQGVRLERAGAAVEIAPRLRLDGGATLAGFAALPGAGPCRLRLLHHSGRSRVLWEGLPAEFDGTPPEGFAAAEAEERAAGLPGTAIPALAAARARLPVRDLPVQIQDFAPCAAPALTLLAPAGEDPDIPRARAALVLAERGQGAVEVTLTVAEGPRAAALRRIAAETAAIYGVAHRIVTLPPDARPAEALRAGLAAARGRTVLALGPAALPEGPGWLRAWRRRLDQGGVAGALLLEADGSVAHAGGAWRGLPRALLPRGASRPARLFSAEAAGLGREAVGRWLAGPGHPDPEVTLAMLAAAERAEGRAAVTALACVCRRFAPPVAEEDFAARLRAHELGGLA